MAANEIDSSADAALRLSAIVIVLNYAIGVRNGQIGVEPNLKSFFMDLLRGCRKIKVAAMVDDEVDPHAVMWTGHSCFDVERLATVRVVRSRIVRALVYPRAIIRILQTAWSNQFFYIFLPGHVPLIAAVACVLFRRRFGIYLRGDWAAVTPLPFRPLKKWLLKRADFVLVTGERMHREVGGCNPRCEKVIPMISFSRPQEPLLRDFKRKGKVRLLYVGQMIRSKGVFELAEAFSQIDDGRNYELVYIGDGPDIGALRTFVCNSGIENQVVFAGFVTDEAKLRAAYRDSDIFVLPTYFPEGFPRVLYEAMIYSLPIVTTDAGDITAVLTEGESCSIVRQRDASDLRRAICLLIESESLRRHIGTNGSKLVDTIIDKDNGGSQSHGTQLLAWAERSKWQ